MAVRACVRGHEGIGRATPQNNQERRSGRNHAQPCESARSTEAVERRIGREGLWPPSAALAALPAMPAARTRLQDRALCGEPRGFEPADDARVAHGLLRVTAEAG